jgi:hypothetical protein
VSELGKDFVICRSSLESQSEPTLVESVPIVEEKRVPLNHQIVARLMGRSRMDDRK